MSAAEKIIAIYPGSFDPPTFGHLDIIFNNAGVGGAIGPVWEIEEAEWDYTFDVLVKGVFFGIKHAVRQFQAQGSGGAIINTASVAGLSGGCGPLAYSAAKAAVVNLTKTLAYNLGPDIRVNAVVPNKIGSPVGKDEFDPTRPVLNLVGRPGGFALLNTSRLICTYSFRFAGTSSSGKIAVTGHSGSHAPQSMHSSGWM